MEIARSAQTNKTSFNRYKNPTTTATPSNVSIEKKLTNYSFLKIQL